MEPWHCYSLTPPIDCSMENLNMKNTLRQRRGTRRAAIISLLLVVLLLAAGARSGACAESVTLLDPPAGTPAHPDFRVSVNGRPLHVYSANISLENKYRQRPYVNRSKPVGFVTFDMASPVVVEIEVMRRQGLLDIKAEVLPRSLGIVPELKERINGLIIRVPLARPCNAVIELNGDPAEHLYIFANPPELNIPAPDAPDVLYFGAGHHEAGEIRPKRDGQTVYLAAGAFVKGHVRIDGLKGVTVRGRGILEGSARDKGTMVQATRCRDLAIRDVIVLNSPTWTLRADDCQGVMIDNVRLIGWRQNTDGIDPVNCEDVTIRNAFIRTWDDGIVIKTLRGKSSRRILAEGCTIITDHATSLKIGANEMIGDAVEDVTFRNMDLLHCCGTPMGIMNLGTAAVSAVRFEDIRVHGVRQLYTGVESGTRPLEPTLILLEIRGENNYLKEFTPGSVSGVTFSGITYEPAGPFRQPVIRMEGLKAGHAIQNVLFKGVRIAGQALTENYAGFRCNEFVKTYKIEN